MPEAAEVPHVVAELVAVGIAPLATRADLRQSVEAQPASADVGRVIDRIDVGSKETGRKTGSSGVSAGSAADSWARVLDPRPDAPPPSAEDAAVALASLRQVEIRDGIVALLMPSTLAPDRLPTEVRKLTDSIRRQMPVPLTEPEWQRGVQERLNALCRLAPDEHAAPALTILGSFAWWLGDGVIARVALDRALRCNPAYRLARLVKEMLDMGIRATDC